MRVAAQGRWCATFALIVVLVALAIARSQSEHQDAANAAGPAGPEARAEKQSTCLVPSGRFVDLTYPFDESTIFWPTERGFLLERGPAGETKGGYYYSANRFMTAEHGGTHLDAPIHFYRGRHSVDQVPLERLMGEAALIDVSRQVDANRDYEVTVADLEAWEASHGRRLDRLIVLVRTGYGRFWPNRQKYLGTSQQGDVALAELHFPGLGADAARWLADQRRVKAVGIDTASIDHGPSRGFRTHITLCEREVPIFENVAHLEGLPELGFGIIALPMKIGGGSGGPLRIVAILPE